MMKKVVVLLGLLALFFTPSEAQFWKKKAKAKSKTNLSLLKSKDKKDYKEILKDFKTDQGVFKVHSKDQKLYFEIPENLFGRDFLLASRISTISNSKDYCAGQMPDQPILIRFDKDEDNVYMYLVDIDNVCEKDAPYYKAVRRNNAEPIFETFKIEAKAPNKKDILIDVSDFFCSSKKELDPFRERNILDIIFKTQPLSGSFVKDGSKILESKSFPLNIKVRSRLNYKVEGEPFVAEMTRTIILLPEEPMRPRIADKRIGYFAEPKVLFNSENDKVKKIAYIDRWRLEPKDEDMGKYMNGVLVEPKKPIVWYVDTAIPLRYRKYIKQGIEDWQPAFEEIGFKNAIIAKDYPTKEEDPDFDPDDIRYSCYRYVATKTANSMGPSWVDPRSGEIICGDVLFYSNVTKLLHNWRFVQTAQTDPRVRCERHPDDLMGASLRYVAAHEVGHTLGLMHNMGASHSIPVDSLRSPKFTQKYGTTTSIMDYARYNYVAQPGDMQKGVRMSPPDLGVYDIYAIKWGYKPIYNAKNEYEEYETLNKWILEKADDPKYYYGEQQFFFYFIDPASNSEDLGDNSVVAARYGIKNLKYIMKNLVDWTTEEGKNYSELQEMYSEVCRQFARYIGHANAYLGGYYLYRGVAGEHKDGHRLVSKEEQKDALNFIVNNLRDIPNWLLDENVTNKFDATDFELGQFTQSVTSGLISSGVIAHITWEEKQSSNPEYTVEEYMGDVFNKIFENTLNGKNLSHWDRLMQYEYVKTLMSNAGALDKPSSKGFKLLVEDNTLYPWKRMGVDLNKIVQAQKESDVKTVNNALYTYYLEKVYKLMKKNKDKGDFNTKIHYNDIYKQLDKYFE